MIYEDITEAEGQPPQEEGASGRSKGKEHVHIVSSSEKSSSTISSSSHGGGDGVDNGKGGTSEFYQHDEDVVPVEDVQEFLEPPSMDPTHTYQWCWRVLPPGHTDEQ